MITIVSKTEKNKDFAKKHKIWQTKQKFHEVKIGDPAFIKVSGSNNFEFLGIIDEIAEEPVLVWPDKWHTEAKNEIQFTVRFRDVNQDDFKVSQHGIWYKK